MVEIRLAQQCEMAILAPIYKNAYNSLNIGEQWSDAAAHTLLDHLFVAQPDLFFVAAEGKELVGAICAVIKPWWDGNHMTDGELFVDPTHQGKGVGKLLVKMLFEVAQKNHSAIVWDTFTHRVYEHPLAWYKKLGFEEVEEWVMISGNVQHVLKNLQQE